MIECTDNSILSNDHKAIKFQDFFEYTSSFYYIKKKDGESNEKRQFQRKEIEISINGLDDTGKLQ